MPRKPNLPPLELKTQETIGTRLASIRRAKGFTQGELAEKIGISQQLLSQYEAGRQSLYDEMVVRLAIILDVSADILLGLKKPKVRKKTST